MSTLDLALVKRLHRCFEQLRQDPFQHPNIKRLKGSLAGYYRYRLGDWRVVYRVEEDGRIVIILLIARRRLKETAGPFGAGLAIGAGDANPRQPAWEAGAPRT